MITRNITLTIPVELFERLERVGATVNQPARVVAAETLYAAFPASVYDAIGKE